MPPPPNRDAAMETTGGCSHSTCPSVATMNPIASTPPSVPDNLTVPAPTRKLPDTPAAHFPTLLFSMLTAVLFLAAFVESSPFWFLCALPMLLMLVGRLAWWMDQWEARREAASQMPPTTNPDSINDQPPTPVTQRL